jgi:rhomboid protease GluP
MANCVVCGRKMPPFSFGKQKCVWCLQYEAAQRGELSDEAPQPVMPAPWQTLRVGSATLTRALVIINVMVFVAMLLTGASLLGGPSMGQLMAWGANFAPYTFGGQWWRLLTYNFIHIGLLHIGFNMWCLWDLGELAESLYGTPTFGAVYMISGVAGGLMSAGWHPGPPSAGASGAIFGLAGALIASYYLGEFSMPKPVIQAHLRSLIFFVVFNVVWGAAAGGVDNSAHFGGLVAGAVCGALIARIAPSSENTSARVAILGIIALVLAGTTFALQGAYGPIMGEMLHHNPAAASVSVPLASDLLLCRRQRYRMESQLRECSFRVRETAIVPDARHAPVPIRARSRIAAELPGDRRKTQDA